MRQRKMFDSGAGGGPTGATLLAEPLAGPTFSVVTRDFGAMRVLGIPREGMEAFRELQETCRRLRKAQSEKGFRVHGPIMTVVRSNPYEVGPLKRSVLTCFPIEGPVDVPEGFELARLEGGMHLLVGCAGPLTQLEDAYYFLFGRFLESRGYELARPSAPMVRHLYVPAPDECEVEEDLITEVAVPVTILMRTDTLQIKRFTG